MKKRKIAFWGVNILLLAMLASAVFMTRPNIQTAQAETLGEAAAERLKQERTQYTGELPLGSVYYNGNKLAFAAQEEKIYMAAADNCVLDPELFSVMTADRKVKFDLAFLDFPSGDTLEESIREGKEFPVLFYNDQYYAEASLVLSGMPVMNLDFTDETQGGWTIVNMSLQSGKYADGEQVEVKAKMRVRGGVSRAYPKLGFKLKLVETDGNANYKKLKWPLLGMRDSDTWNLSALYADDTKIRDKVTIDLWQEMSEDTIPFDADFGTRMEYVEVIMNGDYMGLYGMMEPIDEQQLGIVESALPGASEYYYKKEAEVVAEEADFAFAADARVPEAGDMQIAGLELKNGEGHLCSSAWEPVRRYMKMIREETYEEDAEDLLDLTNVADVWIYIQAIMGVDNRTKNLYYCAKLEDQEYKLYFVPWDMDMTWGNETDEHTHTMQSYYTHPLETIMTWSPATQLIEENIGEIQEIIKERWQELRGGILSEESLIKSMEEADAYVRNSGAYERNKERWEESPHAENITQLEDYAIKRLHVLDEKILYQN